MAGAGSVEAQWLRAAGAGPESLTSSVESERSFPGTVPSPRQHDDVRRFRGRRRLSIEAPLIQQRVGSMLWFLEERRSQAFGARELAQAVELPPQQTALALSALAVVGRASAGYDADRRRQVWRAGSSDQTSSVSSPLRTDYTVAEAAKLTGRSEKALRGRIERGTLLAHRSRRWVFISHAALQHAGLIDNRVKRTYTNDRIRLVVDVLRKEPRRGYSAWELGAASGLRRQTTEVVLASLAAADLVERELAGGLVWRWTHD